MVIPLASQRRREGLPRASAHSHTDFSLRERWQLVNDLFEPNLAIYWTDFLLSIGLGLVALLVSCPRHR